MIPVVYAYSYVAAVYGIYTLKLACGWQRSINVVPWFTLLKTDHILNTRSLVVFIAPCESGTATFLTAFSLFWLRVGVRGSVGLGLEVELGLRTSLDTTSRECFLIAV